MANESVEQVPVLGDGYCRGLDAGEEEVVRRVAQERSEPVNELRGILRRIYDVQPAHTASPLPRCDPARGRRRDLVPSVDKGSDRGEHGSVLGVRDKHSVTGH